MRLPASSLRAAALRALLGTAAAWRPSEALRMTDFLDASLPAQVLSSTSPARGVVETVDAAARSSAVTALRFEEAVEALRDAEEKVMGTGSQSGAARARRTRPKAAKDLDARQPDLAAASLASSGEWQQSVTFGSSDAAVNASGRAARSRRAAAAEGAGPDPLQDKASLALLLGAMATLLVGSLVVVCLVNSWARSPRARTRERPSGEAARSLKKADVEGAGPQPAKREEKASATSGARDRGGLWHWHASELQGCSNSELRPARAGPTSSGHASAEETPLLTAALLCPVLQVPESTRLNCIVENDMCRRRQEMAFNVRGVSGAHLFQVRVAETTSKATPGILLEKLGGEELLAFLSTEEVWQGVARPNLNIFWPNGVHYGTMQKSEEGEYIVQQNGSVVLVYAGDFASHSVKIKSGAGRTVGSISQDSPEEYQVMVHTLNDAGLILLGALAIDKCEMEPASRPPSSMGTSASDVGMLIGEQQASPSRRQSRESAQRPELSWPRH